MYESKILFIGNREILLDKRTTDIKYKFKKILILKTKWVTRITHVKTPPTKNDSNPVIAGPLMDRVNLMVGVKLYQNLLKAVKSKDFF